MANRNRINSGRKSEKIQVRVNQHVDITSLEEEYDRLDSGKKAFEKKRPQKSTKFRDFSTN